MAITDRTLALGTELVASYKRERFTCTVEADEAGKPVFVLSDGRRYSSISAAASAVMHGMAANGFRFWTRASEERPPREKKAKAGREPKAGRTAKGKKGNGASKQINRIANRPDAPEGTKRFFCSACQSAFETMDAEVPAACPQGHPAVATPTA